MRASGERTPLPIGVGVHPALGNGVEQLLMIAFVLRGIRGGKARDREIERVARSKIRRDGDAIARARVGTREGPRARLAVQTQPIRIQALDLDAALPVTQLSEV